MFVYWSVSCIKLYGWVSGRKCALAKELRLSCTNPSILCTVVFHYLLFECYAFYITCMLYIGIISYTLMCIKHYWWYIHHKNKSFLKFKTYKLMYHAINNHLYMLRHTIFHAEMNMFLQCFIWHVFGYSTAVRYNLRLISFFASWYMSYLLSLTQG